MSYFWIAVVVLAAVSPLISMMPTRRQRKIARLRESAALNGLYVELKPLPGVLEEGQTMAFYGCRRGKQDRSALPALYLQGNGSWRASHGQWDPLRIEWLATLPVPITAVSEEPGLVGVYWDERGELTDVELIATSLKALLDRTD